VTLEQGGKECAGCGDAVIDRLAKVLKSQSLGHRSFAVRDGSICVFGVRSGDRKWLIYRRFNITTESMCKSLLGNFKNKFQYFNFILTYKSEKAQMLVLANRTR